MSKLKWVCQTLRTSYTYQQSRLLMKGIMWKVECRLSKEFYFHIKWHDRIWGDPMYMRSFNLNVLTIIY